ncbi:MAG TPA: class I SAM-dependent methyltransferase [Thermoanaerobaculia bacterium]|nr:class I SAM-dependent methyltransferase [Thermoanaerobaculia bacterium]
MSSDSRKQHWESVYQSKPPTEVSWYQPVPARSLELIRGTGEPLSAAVLDVGGGASTLVDQLLRSGYSDVTVLDVAGTALERSRARLGEIAARVAWIEADVAHFRPTRRYAIWHDRAVLHFLIDAADRQRYLGVLRSALRPRGHVVLATFGPQGPARCSGLEVRRYSAEEIGVLLGSKFELRRHLFEEHSTPTGASQQFLYGWWQATS